MSSQDKNMLDFKDISVSSLICDLPLVINHNNDILKTLFTHIYNFDNNYIIKPVFTEGTISGHTGEFNNLKINNGINISSTAANHAFVDNKIVVDHNLSINRNNNAHPFSAIYDDNNKTTLNDTLSSIKTRISKLENTSGTDNSELANQINDISLRLNELFEIINAISFEDNKK